MKRLSRDDTHVVSFMLNGQPRRAACESRTLLSDHLRHGLGATGTHVGCEHGCAGLAQYSSMVWPGVHA